MLQDFGDLLNYPPILSFSGSSKNRLATRRVRLERSYGEADIVDPASKTTEQIWYEALSFMLDPPDGAKGVDQREKKRLVLQLDMP